MMKYNIPVKEIVINIVGRCSNAYIMLMWSLVVKHEASIPEERLDKKKTNFCYEM